LKIIPITTGYTLVSSAVVNRETHRFSFAYTGLFQSRKKRICIPVKCFYVEINSHKFLVDAGWSKECKTNALKHLGFGLFFASEPVMKDEESAIYQLNEMGIKEESLDGIYMTHLDCDHVSGVHDFNNIPIYSSQDEIDYSKENKLRYGKMTKGLSLFPLTFNDDEEAPFGRSLDVFHDKSVIAYLTPTHSKGSIIYKICDNRSFALIVGDNGYNQDSWDKGYLPGPLYNKGNTREILKWIKKQSLRDDCLGVFCAHDPLSLKGVDNKNS